MVEYRNIQAYSFEPERSQANSDEFEDKQAQEIVDSQNVLSLTAQVDRETPTLTDRRTNNLGWYSCSECVIMPTEDECLCCHELSHQLGPKLGEYTCVTANPVFLSVCLLEDVLETALVCMRETHRDPVR